MTAINLEQRTLAEIAAALPGATAVFRRHKLDFCCGGGRTLATATAERGIALEALAAELVGMQADAAARPPQAPAALIGHILERYHETHRRELPELIRLARKVEAVHKDHAAAPHGLAEALTELLDELDSHMRKEEQVLFPLMRQGGHAMIGHPIARMREEHDAHGLRLRRLEALTGDCTLPAGGCATWAALYAGLRKLIDDVHEHVHLENNVLFPQFAGAHEVPAGGGH